MDDKQVGHLGAELARLVEDTLDKSLPDINSALGNHHGQNMIEFIALLLWIAVKEAQTVLPEKLIQPTIDTIFTVFFLRLVENVNFLKIFNNLPQFYGCKPIDEVIRHRRTGKACCGKSHGC